MLVRRCVGTRVRRRANRATGVSTGSTPGLPPGGRGLVGDLRGPIRVAMQDHLAIRFDQLIAPSVTETPSVHPKSPKRHPVGPICLLSVSLSYGSCPCERIDGGAGVPPTDGPDQKRGSASVAGRRRVPPNCRVLPKYDEASQ